MHLGGMCARLDQRFAVFWCLVDPGLSRLMEIARCVSEVARHEYQYIDPSRLVSLCIAWRHARRYPSRRRERIRYATLKPQLAFTASGRPVAVYLPQTYELVDVSRLSIDSLQADRDSQSSGSEHQRRISHSFAGYQQASTNLAL